MGDFLTTASSLMCPHGGTVSVTSSNTKARADGAFVARPGDTFTIAGCPFTLPSGTAHPCVRVQWTVAALRNKAASDAALTRDSVGLCLAADSAPQGTVLVQQTQARVRGL